MKRLLFLTVIVVMSVNLAAVTKVACVGNSITYGFLLPNREQEAYPFQLQRLLGDDYVVGNFGKSRSTLLSKGHFPYVEQEEFKSALAFGADVVIIALGTNDTDPRNWPNYKDEFVPNYRALIDSFRAVNPKCRFYVCKVIPIFHWHPRFESGTRDWLDEVNECVEVVAKTSGAELVDLHTPLYAHPNLVPDAIHPNANGAAIIARTLYQRLTGDYGGLQVPALYTDNMVLQRNKPIVLHGRANAREVVKVKFGGKLYATRTTVYGVWKVELPAMGAGKGYELRIATKERELVFKNVCVGEVWLCSGQSNMEFELRNSFGFNVDSVANSDVFLFDMKARWRTDDVSWSTGVLDSVNDLDYFVPTKWESCTAETGSRFSAVAYYFGKVLQDSLKVPIGLICNAVGGSPCESWIDRCTLEHDFTGILKDWKENDFIQEWVRERAKKNIELSKDNLQRHPYEPCYLFESGILPLEHYGIAGVIWYQGESNAHNVEAHEKLFPLLIRSWRDYFDNPLLPFYYAQLSSIDRPSWSLFRNSQRLMMYDIPHVGMAVTSDLGDRYDVHPTHKKEVGQRLAAQVLNGVYHYNVVPSGPLFKGASLRKNKVVVTFDYNDGLQTADGGALRGFELAGEDCIFYPATAMIKNNDVILSSCKVKSPLYVRYGWGGFTDANLVNGANYPSSTFYTKLK